MAAKTKSNPLGLSSAELKAYRSAGIAIPKTAAEETRAQKQLGAYVTEFGANTGGTGSPSPTVPSIFSLPKGSLSSSSKGTGVETPTDLQGLEVPYARAGQQNFGLHAQQATYMQIVAAFRALDVRQREDIQRNLYQAGFYGSTQPTLDGAFTTSDLDALQAAVREAYGSGVPLVTLLLHGAHAGDFVSQVKSLQTAIKDEQLRAQTAVSPSANLTDPNQIRQTFAVAMESMGAGAPDPALADRFVEAFHGAEVNAVQNAAEVQKQNLLAAIPGQQQQIRELQTGNAKGAAALAAQPGPVSVATKAMPNLDAEARAAAEADNPAAYYANQMSDLAGLIINSMDGSISWQQRPENPSAGTPVGGILSTPLAGAA